MDYQSASELQSDSQMTVRPNMSSPNKTYRIYLHVNTCVQMVRKSHTTSENTYSYYIVLTSCQAPPYTFYMLQCYRNPAGQLPF